MKFYEFTWRITEKQVYQSYQGYSDVIYYVGWDCLGELRDYNPDTDTDTWYSATTTGGMNIPFNPSTNYITLGNVTDDDIFDWLINNGLDRVGIETDLKQKLDAMITP